MKKIDKRTKAYKDWKKSQESIGLGDIVEKITEATGIKKIVEALTEDCGCNDRKKNWNKTRLFKKNLAPRCLTDLEISEWKTYRDNDDWKIEGLKLYPEDINYLWKMYQSVFNVSVSKPCTNCSPKPIMYMIDAIDTLYNESIS
tara:strand:- start:540 stop:971 length:432 start_codon:yes stop_codon:yes gene_type:complete